LDGWILSAGASAVRDVFVGGRHVVHDRHHALERPALEAYRACLHRLLD
jgi:hypothetical protein